MNFFFGLAHSELRTKLTVPRFQNGGRTRGDLRLFEASVSDGQWCVTALDDDGNGLFFEPVNRKNSEAIYFIAAMSEVGAREIKLERLTTFNDFTDTVPDYRANLEVLNDKAGFSSYQAEYPFKMTERSGAIVSSLATLTNKNADQNLLFFRNIFHVPEHKTGRGYIISKTRRQVLRHIELVTNSTTCVTLRADEMGADCYFVSSDMLGIPVYVSTSKNGAISMEHTHPPHSNVLGPRQFELTRRVKNELLEIVSEATG